MRQLSLSLVLYLGVGFSTVLAAPDAATLHSATSSLICVCGCSNMIVSSCECATATELTAEVSALLESGHTKDEVIETFVEKYGSWVRAAPTTEGFNLLAWLLPFGALGLGVVIVLFTLKKLKMNDIEVDSEEVGGTPVIDPRIQHQLEKELWQQDIVGER